MYCDNCGLFLTGCVFECPVCSGRDFNDKPKEIKQEQKESKEVKKKKK